MTARSQYAGTEEAGAVGEPPELDTPEGIAGTAGQRASEQGDEKTKFRSLKTAVIDRAMGADMTEHLGYGPGETLPDGQRNHRNGANSKTVLTVDGPVSNSTIRPF